MPGWRDLISRLRRRCRVLIVEDEVSVARDLAALVHRAGGRVVGIAADSVPALLLAAEHRPHVAIIDIDLPSDTYAIQLAREIRDMTDTKIVFCGADDDLSRVRLAGFEKAELLLKPVDFESLSRVMQRVC